MIPYIFIVRVDKLLENDIFNFLLLHTSDERKKKILNQRVKKNADNMIIGDTLVKACIKKVFGVKMCNQKIAYGKKGKPYIENYTDIHFNVSHSGDYVVCAVGNSNIGVDIQKIAEYKPRLAQKVCSADEMMQIENSLDMAIEFTKIWTRKEAYLKYLGVGISGSNLKNIPGNTNKKICSKIYNEYIISVVW